MGDNYRAVDLTANASINVGDDDLGVPNMNTYSINSNTSTNTLYTFQSDTIGNITNIGNVTLDWNGRRLESISQSGTELISYEYNMDGQRVQKTVNGVTTEYFYNGSILAGQRTGNDIIIFMYDNNGDVFGFEYNGTPYYYVKNAQNDVIIIVDENNQPKVLYQYDAWGKVIECLDGTDFGLASKNPIMYRSYYVDLELGMFIYYLNSRYYVADWGRFASADSVVGVTADILSYNIFTYCFNNPIILIDTDGTCPYNGTAADFHRLEHGLPSLDCKCEDLTDKLTSYMEENVENLKKYKEENGFIKTTKYFYNNVKDGGALDIKLQDEWQFEEGKKYIFNGKQLRYDDPGNINFGYVGAVIFPEGILCFGAGLNQIGKYGFEFGNLSTWYDDPRDNEMIKYGYQLYEEAQK